MNIQELLNKVHSKITNFPVGVDDFIVEMEKLHRERMETPTACKICEEIHLYKDLLPELALHFHYSDDYTRIIHSKAGYGLHIYCTKCWEHILQKVKKEYKVIKLHPREANRVEEHNEKARLKGIEATLTLPQWIETLEGFNWQCAYCLVRSFDHLEHIIPIARRAGTTANNCVPACRSCNSSKGILLPEEIKETSRSPEAHRRVAAKMQELHGNSTSNII